MPDSPFDAGDEELAEARHHGARGGAEDVRRGRHVAPAEDFEAFLGGDRGHRVVGLEFDLVVVRDERETDGVRTSGGQFEIDDLAQEDVRHLDQDPGAVAGVHFRPGGAAVLEVTQRSERLFDDAVTGHPGERRDEGDAARVSLGPRVVKALSRRYAAQQRGVLPVR